MLTWQNKDTVLKENEINSLSAVRLRFSLHGTELDHFRSIGELDLIRMSRWTLVSRKKPAISISWKCLIVSYWVRWTAGGVSGAANEHLGYSEDALFFGVGGDEHASLRDPL